MLKRYTAGREDWVLLDEDFNVLEGKDHRSARWAQLEIRSVQHTGTNFIHKVLMDAGWNCRATHWTNANVKDTGLMISPIRNPKDVWVTWCSRDRQEDFNHMWSLFNQVYLENPNLFIVPVDTEDREDYLNLLSQRLKCDLKTDWTPVESREHKNYMDRDLSNIYELPVVRKFYG